MEAVTLDESFLGLNIVVEGGTYTNGSSLIAADGADPVITSAGWGYAKNSSASGKINVCVPFRFLAFQWLGCSLTCSMFLCVVVLCEQLCASAVSS